MKYEEPDIDVRLPLSVLHHIEASLLHEVFTLYSLRNGGKRVNSRTLNKAEQALSHVSDAIIRYEASLIIGDALSDNALSQAFPTKPKRKKRMKKQ